MTPTDAGGADAASPTGDGAASPHPDAGAAPNDAGTPPGDAGAGETGTPLRNGGFELTELPAQPGPLLPGDARIDPWRWCGGTVSVGPELGGYAASEGQTLLSMSFSAGPAMISQQLALPLRAEQPYAYAVDAARSESGVAALRLQLVAQLETCAAPTALAETPALELESAGLARYCLVFTAPFDVSHLGLRVMDVLALDGTVYVDNLRPDPSCE